MTFRVRTLRMSAWAGFLFANMKLIVAKHFLQALPPVKVEDWDGDAPTQPVPKTPTKVDSAHELTESEREDDDAKQGVDDDEDEDEEGEDENDEVEVEDDQVEVEDDKEDTGDISEEKDQEDENEAARRGRKKPRVETESPKRSLRGKRRGK